MRRLGPVAVLTLVLVGCGAPSSPAAGQVVENYLYALAEGNYGNACGLLDGHTRASVQTPTASCPAVFARCLRNEAVALKRDQTQQLYATINLSITRSKGDAEVSGTAVARTVREVTLADERGTWRLTSYGAVLRGCRR